MVAGGAFTVSALIVSTLGIKFESPTALLFAWGAWGLCLLLCAGGHLVSAKAHQHVTQQMGRGQYDVDVLLGSRAAKAVRLLNIATYLFLVTGFIAFGSFTYDNLDFEREQVSESQKLDDEAKSPPAQGRREQLSKTYAIPEEGATHDNQRVEPAETGDGVAKTETTAQGGSHDGQAKAADAPATAEKEGVHQGHSGEALSGSEPRREGEQSAAPVQP